MIKGNKKLEFYFLQLKFHSDASHIDLFPRWLHCASLRKKAVRGKNLETHPPC